MAEPTNSQLMGAIIEIQKHLKELPTRKDLDKLEGKFDKLEGKFDQLETKSEKNFERLDAKIDVFWDYADRRYVRKSLAK